MAKNDTTMTDGIGGAQHGNSSAQAQIEAAAGRAIAALHHGGSGAAWAFLALVRSQLDHAEEALRLLDEASSEAEVDPAEVARLRALSRTEVAEAAVGSLLALGSLAD